MNHKYDIAELKQLIGTDAEKIIADHFGIVPDKSGDYRCQMTKHGGETKMRWLGDTFRCINCTKLFDICSLAAVVAKDNQMAYLKELAGVTDNGEFKVNRKSPFKKGNPQMAQTKKYNKNFSGLPEFKSLAEGLSKNALNWLSTRGFDLQTLKKMLLTGDDENVYFNYCSVFNQGYSICKIKGRRIGEIKNGDDKYLKIGGGESILFGAHNYQGQSRLIVCEGELDATAMQQGIDYINVGQHAMAVSVPAGAKSFGWIEQCEEFLRQFEVIILCPDSNADGVAMREKGIEKLTEMNFDVRWIDISRQIKDGDINDLLKTQGNKAVADLLSIIEHPSHSCGLIGNQIESVKRNDFFTGFFGIDRSCKFKYGETIVFAGDSNGGKTTLARQFMLYPISKGIKIGIFSGEEDNDIFRDLCIRQVYGDAAMMKGELDYYGDSEPVPKPEYIDRWNKEYGSKLNLFQQIRVRDIEVVGEKILDWIRHCADVEGRKVIYIDNLMKVTACDNENEYKAQANFMENIYKLAQQKRIIIMLIVHTKKGEGFITGNSIHGSKKIYNTPDYVLFLERPDRMAHTKNVPRGMAEKFMREDAKMGPDIQFDSVIRSHKIRNRPTCYNITTHLLRYDPLTTCSIELLSAQYHKRTHGNGYSALITWAGTILPETQPAPIPETKPEPAKQQSLDIGLCQGDMANDNVVDYKQPVEKPKPQYEQKPPSGAWEQQCHDFTEGEGAFNDHQQGHEPDEKDMPKEFDDDVEDDLPF